MIASEIMTKTVITATAAMPVGDVAERLRRHRISAVPVVDSAGAVLGIVSEHDLLTKPGGTAGEVMSTGVISVSTDTEVDDVRHLLVDRRIRRVPVLAAQQLVGIISRADVVALLAMEWVCRVCGEVFRGATAPESCACCHATGDNFVHEEQPPGD